MIKKQQLKPLDADQSVSGSVIMNLQSEEIYRILSSVRFSHYRDGSESKQLIDGQFLGKIVESDPRSTDFAGEKVLTVQRPDGKYDTSVHFMNFEGNQQPHVHQGPRLLLLSSQHPWTLYIGEAKELPKEGPVPLVGIIFPTGGVTVIELQAGTPHAFAGKMNAISIHYTDIAEAKKCGLSTDALGDPDMMAKLTLLIEQHRLVVVAKFVVGPEQHATSFTGRVIDARAKGLSGGEKLPSRL